MYHLLNHLEHIGDLFVEGMEIIFLRIPWAKNLTSYKHLHNRLVSSAGNIQTVYELLRNWAIQKPNSILCGLICIYIPHNFFVENEIVILSDVELIRFALHVML